MNSIKEAIATIIGWLRSLSEVGIALILAFVVIDVLFPGTTPVVENIGVIVGQFSEQGLVGLIALLLFLMLFKK
ncbi:MAG: hypothetical protein P8J55_02950 [Pseudomonadales bacterium]|nr:hypothetical protein [Pseudomonadales bacterium]